MRADLTQAELANLIGTTQSVIARIAAACGAHFEFGFIFLKVR